MIQGILQARVGSTRLPGKVLMPLCGEPMLIRQVERLMRAKNIDRLTVATSQMGSDDAIASLCEKHGIDCFRGPLEDVLERFYQVACKSGAEHIVRINGDCPLIDPKIVDDSIEFHIENVNDYTSTGLCDPRIPDGFGVDIFTFNCLKKIWTEAFSSFDREHVITYLRDNPDLFHIRSFCGKRNLDHVRACVDDEQDFEHVKWIFESLYPKLPNFTLMDVVEFIGSADRIATRPINHDNI